MKRFPDRDMPSWRRSVVPSWRRNLEQHRAAPLSARRGTDARRIELKLARQLALQLGIQPAYRDMEEKVHEAGLDTLKGLIEAMGWPAGRSSEMRESLRALRLRRLRQRIEPVAVAWDGKPIPIVLQLSRDLLDERVFCKIHFEDGRSRSLDVKLNQLRNSGEIVLGGERFVTKKLTLPELPLGYHRLEIEIRGRNSTCLLIAAPMKSYSPIKEFRSWGVFLPLYAARSKQGWCGGTLGDWERLIEWVGENGGRVMGTTPCLAAFCDEQSCEPSPYSPASRLFWNEFYLDIGKVPEFHASKAVQQIVKAAGFQKRLKGFREAELIDYPAEVSERRMVVERMGRSLLESETPRRLEFLKFVEQRPGLRDYAEFRAAAERHTRNWRCWEERMRLGKIQKGDYSERDREFHEYAQWLMEEQIRQLQEGASRANVALYLDLPLGVSPDSYDMWRERDLFARAEVGAPPDLFFSKGQNWGFAPLQPHKVREQGYTYPRRYLEFQMRHCGVLRIDHVMGLHRLYCIPKGLSAKEGAYAEYAAEEWLAILSLESHRHKTILVGENLGTVPARVNESMDRHALRKMFVLPFEFSGQALKPLRVPAERTVASLNTHDLPPFAAFWKGLDLQEAVKIGALEEGQLPAKMKQREQHNLLLAEFLEREGWLKKNGLNSEAVMRASLKWLCSTPAEIVLVNLEDLWGETRPQNVPGTSHEQPNWRRKAKLALEDIVTEPEFSEFLKHLSQIRLHTTRESGSEPSASKG